MEIQNQLIGQSAATRSEAALTVSQGEARSSETSPTNRILGPSLASVSSAPDRPTKQPRLPLRRSPAPG